MRKARAEIENEIRFEMYWLKRIAQEINDYNTKGAAISKAAQFHIANAVLPAKSRIEYAKALRLRIRLFRTTRNCALPSWVKRQEDEKTSYMDNRIAERLRADLYKKIGFVPWKKS